jgi:hypothetical protein
MAINNQIPIESLAMLTLEKDLENQALKRQCAILQQEIDKLKREAANAQMAKNPKERES